MARLAVITILGLQVPGVEADNLCDLIQILLSPVRAALMMLRVQNVG